jgi:hypothetical protein
MKSLRQVQYFAACVVALGLLALSLPDLSTACGNACGGPYKACYSNESDDPCLGDTGGLILACVQQCGLHGCTYCSGLSCDFPSSVCGSGIAQITCPCLSACP